MRRFWNQSGDMALIAHEHNLLLVVLERVEDRTEVARDFGRGQDLHAITLSD